MQELKVCRPELPILKVNRHELEIGENDIVGTNGAYWWFRTRMKYEGWKAYPMPVSKTLCKKLVKKGVLYVVETDERNSSVQYYKFDIEKLKLFLKEEAEKKKLKEKQ